MMNLFKRKQSRIGDPNRIETDPAQTPTGNAEIGYKRLEQRQVLSASFIAGASGIILNNFDPGQDLDFAQTTANVNGAFQDAYLFTVDSGDWTGLTASPHVEVESVNGGTNNQLQVATSLFGGASNAQLTFDGATTTGTEVEFSQSSSLVTFDSLNISNFTNDNNSFETLSVGDVAASDIQVIDSNPNDTNNPFAQIEIQTQGTITTSDDINNLTTNPSNGILLDSNGANNDVTINGQVRTIDGTIDIAADDSVLLNSNALVTTAGSGNIEIEAGNSISNAAGSGQTIVTNSLSLDAQNGIGELNNAPLRINTDTLSATNSGPGDIRIFEQDSVELDSIDVANGNLFIDASVNITDNPNSQIVVPGHSQFNAGNEVVLGEQATDFVDLGSVGLVSQNAHIDVNSDLVIDGSTPNQQPALFGQTASRGTLVAQTLFVNSTGSVVQSLGQLNAQNIGIQSDQFVHLASVSANNDAIGISAGASGALTDLDQIQELNALSAIENSEVNPTLEQAIAVKHEGTFNATTVTSHIGTQSAQGLTSTEGSIFASSVEDLNLIQNITASSTQSDPQVTLYSESGSAGNPGVNFVGGVASVNGPTNIGLVNADQTVATFFDQDNEVLAGTTEILLLNTDGSADQDIVLEYGHIGEQGYRVGFVWDFLNQPGAPVEVINTYVSDPNLVSEQFDDTIFQNNPNTLQQIGGNEGGRETFAKVTAYSQAAIVAHQDDPNVFTEVTVRNDQDINLFTGPIEATTNTLNETTQVLRAELDSPKRFVPNLPTIGQINPIPTRSPVELPIASNSPDSSGGFTFSRDVQPFETGGLKWVQVQIPISELEQTGDEVRLKDPTKVFGSAEGVELNELDDAIGENEVEKIIEVIESDEKSEAGYWYKVFKDYRNRDDELFFYHFKTGENQGDEVEVLSTESTELQPETDDLKQPDLNTSKQEPVSDFVPQTESEIPDPEPEPSTSSDNSEDEPTNDAETRQFKLKETSSLLPPVENGSPVASFNSDDSTNITPPPANSLSAGALMMASLLVKNSKTSRSENSPDAENENQTSTNDQPVDHVAQFTTLQRLKRKMRNLIRQ